MNKTVGIIPAAGRATRLRPFRYPKELFPIGYVWEKDKDRNIELKVVCQYVMECLVAADIAQAYIVMSDHKFEVVRFLADGADYGLNLAYLYQRELLGLPFAIDCAYQWMKDAISVLVLPDTILEPYDCVRQTLNFLYETSADLVLGVFPTDHPEDLCPVQFDTKGKVQKLYDKATSRGLMNTWGLAVWQPRFADFLHEQVRATKLAAEKESILADIFSQAITQGLKVYAFPIPQGKFWDIGKSSSLIKARQEFEKYPQ